MEYVRFDNEKLNKFFSKILGKEQFTLEEIVGILTSEETGIHYDNTSVKDFCLLQQIEKQGKKRNSDFKINMPKIVKLQGGRIEHTQGKNKLIINFSDIDESTFLYVTTHVPIKEVIINSFRGITSEKLKALGECDYRVERDHKPTPYSLAEMEQLLQIMEYIKSQAKSLEDIDKFLSAYKSIGMHADYDDIGQEDLGIVLGISTMKEFMEALEKESEESRINGGITRSLKGVLIDGRAVCYGYALALKYVCDYMGMEIEIQSRKCSKQEWRNLGRSCMESSKHRWRLV